MKGRIIRETKKGTNTFVKEQERSFVKRGTIRRKRLFVKREKTIETKGSFD